MKESKVNQVRALSAAWTAGIGLCVALAACGDTGELYEHDDRVEVSAAASAVACLASAGDERAAETMARACGDRVEVESGRSEYAQLYVEPSGLRTLVTSVVPQRARRSDGTWGAIDTTLQRIGDTLAPAATAVNVRFSTGGSGPFAIVTSERHSFTLSWPAPLPKPTVVGDSATYAEVLPEVDLVVKATDAGFTPMLVIKTARAAASPAVRRVRYRIGGDAELASMPAGGLRISIGGTHLASAEPEMRSLAEQPAGVAATAAGDEPTAVARVGSAITDGHLVLTPDPSVLDDPGTVFPMAIVPPISVAQWAYASILNSGTSTTDNTVAPGDYSPASTVLKVGNDPDSSHLIRSFMRFPIGAVGGKQIIAAKIDGRVDHTTKCTVPRPTYFYRSAGIAASPRQAWPGPQLQVLLGNNNVHANEKSCSEQNMPFEISSAALISDLQAFANGFAGDYVVGISAGEDGNGTNETNAERWMRYFLLDFKLQITFNTKPNTPDNLTVDGKPCVAGTGRPFIKTTTPTLRARVSDPDLDSLNVWFTWAKWNGSAFIDEPGSGPNWLVPSGGTALFNVTGNVDGGIYTFRVQSDDGASHQPFLASDVTHMPGNCEWQVDITPPAVPTVTADVYLESPGGCGGGPCGSVGETGRFTFESSADTQSFRWGFSDPPTGVLTPATLGGRVILEITPSSSGARTLFVRAIDRAGNESNRAYQFQIAEPSTPRARWLLNDAAGSPSLDDDSGNGNTVPVSGVVLGAPGRIVPGPDGISRSAMQLDGTSAGVSTAGPVLADTSKSFSVAAWVKLTDNTVSRRVVEQVGTSASAFRLEYDRTANAWKITTPSLDGAATPGATSVSTPRLHTWTHLVGVYDSGPRTLKLYVNGVLERTVTGIATWDANGGMRIGNGWAGAISEVEIWNRVISTTEAFDLSDPIQVGLVGDWHMNDVGPGPTFDSSGMAHDLTFFGGAVIPPGGSGQTGTGLRLDGVNDYAAPDDQVLYTDQSFTVSLWARLTTMAVDQTLIAQQSSGSHGGFALLFGAENGGVWKFRMHASATDTTNTTFAAAPAVGVTAYHHLVGVFDAQRAELRLYVDGVLQATTPMNGLWQPWAATGPLLIGRHHNGTLGSEFTAGDVDEVRAYQGVVVNVTRIP
jgi:hypothetical protein